MLHPPISHNEKRRKRAEDEACNVAYTLTQTTKKAQANGSSSCAQTSERIANQLYAEAGETAHKGGKVGDARTFLVSQLIHDRKTSKMLNVGKMWSECAISSARV